MPADNPIIVIDMCSWPLSLELSRQNRLVLQLAMGHVESSFGSGRSFSVFYSTAKLPSAHHFLSLLLGSSVSFG